MFVRNPAGVPWHDVIVTVVVVVVVVDAVVVVEVAVVGDVVGVVLHSAAKSGQQLPNLSHS